MRSNVYCGNLLDIRRPEVASRSEVARAVQSVLTLPRSRRFGLKSGTIVTLDQSDFAVEDGCDIHIVSAADYLTKGGLPS